jgi:hypothetical protein
MSKVNQELRVGERLTLNVKQAGMIQIVLVEKSGQRARLSIDSDEDAVKISYSGNNTPANVAKGGLTLK